MAKRANKATQQRANKRTKRNQVSRAKAKIRSRAQVPPKTILAARIRNEFRLWTQAHSQKPASAYHPGMSDIQVARAHTVFIDNKLLPYGEVDVGREILDYMDEYGLSYDLDEKEREFY